MSTFSSSDNQNPPNSHMTGIVERNIKALLERKQTEDKNRSTENRIADTITHFTGSMAFVYIHIAFFGLWIIWNLGWLGLKSFDPSFVVLAMEASVEAIFLSTFVLISQNRMNAQADKRADLDLQVSLLAEHEVTRLITLVSEMAKKMGIEEANHPEIEELSKDVRPENVLNTIEKHQEKISDPEKGKAGNKKL